MNNVISRNIWSSFAFAAVATLAASSVIADDLGTIEVTGTRTDGGSTYNGGSISRGIGGGGGPRIQILDPKVRGQIAADAAKIRQCKAAAADALKLCNAGQVTLHTYNSSFCRGAYWVGGALGVAGGWAAVEGEAAGSVLLAGSGMAIYQWGDDCQTDMDRVFSAGLANCSQQQVAADNACEQ